jgi:hypothetical protein
MLLVALVLAVPVVVVANPVDQIWIPGLYDDADTDQMVLQAMSPESLLGTAIPVVWCLLSSIAVVWSSRSRCMGAVKSGLVARAPPHLCGAPTRLFSLDARRAEGAGLAILTIQRTSFLPRFLHSSDSESDEVAVDDEGQSRQQASPLIPHRFLPPGTRLVTSQPVERLIRFAQCDRRSTQGLLSEQHPQNLP